MVYGILKFLLLYGILKKIIEVIEKNLRYVTTGIKKQFDIERITLLSLKDTEINANIQVIVGYAELSCVSETVLSVLSLTSIIRLYTSEGIFQCQRYNSES